MRRHAGFTLSELLVALVVTSLVIGGVMGFFASQRRIAHLEQMSAAVDDGLRVGLMRISDRLRDAGYGVPPDDLALWIPWVGGLASNPQVRDGAAGAPDALDIAMCPRDAVSTLSATAARGGRTLYLDDGVPLDTDRRRLINIGGREPAHVVVTGSAVRIDTDPSDTPAQGLARTYFAGTTVCRVEVVTFAVDTENARLTVDDNGGDGPRVLLDGISDLQVEPLADGRRFEITLTARSGAPGGSAGASAERSASTLVTVRN